MSHNHITDIEAQELVRGFEKSFKVPQKYFDCEQCSMVITEYISVFNEVKKSTEVSPENDLWKNIETQKSSLQEKKKLSLRNWSLTSIAASFFLAAVFLWSGVQNEKSLNNQVQAAILQSQLLERTINNNQKFQQAGNFELDEMTFRLESIDEKLQLAYTENKETAVILKLWNDRVDLLIHISESSPSKHNLEII